MNNRALWVIEWSPEKGMWFPWTDRPAHRTRREARARLSGFNLRESVRVVKYVPAETYKKAGVK